MSLAIDIDRVSAVLLADGWHKVADASFYLDSNEYIEGNNRRRRLPAAPRRRCERRLRTGFSFLEDLDENAGGAYVGRKMRLCGPLTAVLAVTEEP